MIRGSCWKSVTRKQAVDARRVRFHASLLLRGENAAVGDEIVGLDDRHQPAGLAQRGLGKELVPAVDQRQSRIDFGVGQQPVAGPLGIAPFAGKGGRQGDGEKSLREFLMLRVPLLRQLAGRCGHDLLGLVETVLHRLPGPGKTRRPGAVAADVVGRDRKVRMAVGNSQVERHGVRRAGPESPTAGVQHTATAAMQSDKAIALERSRDVIIGWPFGMSSRYRPGGGRFRGPQWRRRSFVGGSEKSRRHGR